jgi:hypothetical protein
MKNLNSFFIYVLNTIYVFVNWEKNRLKIDDSKQNELLFQTVTTEPYGVRLDWL